MADLDNKEKEQLLQMIEDWQRYHTAVAFLCGLGSFLKWAAGIGGFLLLLWGAIHSGTGSPR
jgi:hypothetical protein